MPPGLWADGAGGSSRAHYNSGQAARVATKAGPTITSMAVVLLGIEKGRSTDVIRASSRCLSVSRRSSDPAHGDPPWRACRVPFGQALQRPGKGGGCSSRQDLPPLLGFIVVWVLGEALSPCFGDRTTSARTTPEKPRERRQKGSRPVRSPSCALSLCWPVLAWHLGGLASQDATASWLPFPLPSLGAMLAAFPGEDGQ